MNENQFERALGEFLYFGDKEEYDIHIDNIKSFEEEGLVTKDKGLVIKLSDGSEFYLNIQKVI